MTSTCVAIKFLFVWRSLDLYYVRLKAVSKQVYFYVEQFDEVSGFAEREIFHFVLAQQILEGGGGVSLNCLLIGVLLRLHRRF